MFGSDPSNRCRFVVGDRSQRARAFLRYLASMAISVGYLLRVADAQFRDFDRQDAGLNRRKKRLGSG